MAAVNGDMPFGGASFGNLEDSSNQQALLNPNESDMMGAFFKNPDGFSMNDNFLGLGSGSEWDTEVSGVGIGAQLDGLDQASQTISNPASTLGGPIATNYQTHSGNQQVQSQTSDFGHPTNRTFDDWEAANSLYNISSHRQEPPQPSVYHSGLGASWGAVHTMDALDNTQSPMTSSGRQSASSLYGHSHHPSLNHMQAYQSGTAQQHMPRMWQQQSNQVQSRPHARHHSLQEIDTTSIHLFPPQNQVHVSQSAHPANQRFHKPTMVRFGSDSQFSNHGFHNPNGYGAQEEVKANNLNNVPLAAQAAANGPPHMQGLFSAAGYPRTHHHYPSFPVTSPTFQDTNSSPSHLGGLPIISPPSSGHHHGHPFNQMARHTIEDDHEDEDVDDVKPRKRRKSQMELEEDAEYSPHDHVKNTMPKRGSKTTRAAEDSADDDDEVATPSYGKGAAKRKKSSKAAGRDDGSNVSPSSSAGRPSSSIKKSRNSQSRQNLSDEQKRQNHIRSEKHRRDLIKSQYDQLDNLVPALKNGKTNMSRADVLEAIVAYVESTVAGNVTMEGNIARLSSARSGASSSRGNG